MSRVVHFELPADDPERAARFYSDVFGWKVQKWEGPMEYWLLMTGDPSKPGIDGGLMRACPDSPPRTPINTIGVESVDESVARVCGAGGSVAMPKHAIPGVGWIAYCKDTEGVLFGLMQEDRHAA